MSPVSKYVTIVSFVRSYFICNALWSLFSYNILVRRLPTKHFDRDGSSDKHSSVRTKDIAFGLSLENEMNWVRSVMHDVIFTSPDRAIKCMNSKYPGSTHELTIVWRCTNLQTQHKVSFHRVCLRFNFVSFHGTKNFEEYAYSSKSSLFNQAQNVQQRLEKSNIFSRVWSADRFHSCDKFSSSFSKVILFI